MLVKNKSPFFYKLTLLLLLFVCLSWPQVLIAQNRPVKAGIFNFDGYHMMDDAGRLSGYGIEVLDLISEYSHLNFIPVGYEKSWEEMLKMLEDGEIDVVTSARRTPARDEKFSFTLPIGRNSTILSIRRDNTSLKGGDYKTYNGMKVGLIKGSSQNSRLQPFAEKHGFTYEPIEYADMASLEEDLQKGKIDAILSSNLRKQDNEKLLDTLETSNFFAIVRKDDEDLINEINYAIDQINLNEGDWKNLLFYKYYGPAPSSEVTFTGREERYLRDIASGKKTLTFTARGDRPPYSYVENGRLTGILPDFFGQIMAELNLPYTSRPVESVEEYNELVDNNEVEVIIDYTSDSEPLDKNEYTGFSTTPYLASGLVQVTKQNAPETVRKVGIAQNGPRVDAGLVDGVVIIEYPSAQVAMDAVLNDSVDAAIVMPFEAQVLTNDEHYRSLRYRLLNDKGLEFRMFVPNSADHELATILKKVIQQMPPATMNHLSSRYTSFNARDLDIISYIRFHPYLLTAILLTVFLVGAVILFLYMHARWSRSLVHATESSRKQLADQLKIVQALSRDYTNVFAINDKSAMARVVKLDGYMPKGINMDRCGEYSYATMINKYIADRVHPEDREYMHEAMSLKNVSQKLVENDEYTGSYRILEDGETHYYQFIFVNMRNAGEAAENFILVGFRNIDEMISREHEQRAILTEALAKAQYANKAKTTFLNNMSHDIRTPMNAIIGFSSLAMSHIGNIGQVKSYLEKISTSGNHLLNLINDVLDMSRIESGKVKIEEKEVSLPAILHELRTITQSDVEAKQLKFKIDAIDVVNETIISDRLRLNQVLLNILSNAMKYTAPGGKVGVQLIQTSPEEAGFASYEFRIYDTGIGMSPEFLEHVFEPFEREQTTTVSGIQGTGLGLAITKNIVDMMGGAISCTSTQNKGSEFCVAFRFRIAKADKDRKSLEYLTGMRALVAADVTTCSNVCRMLSSLGISPSWTTHGKEALSRAQEAKEQGKPFGLYIINRALPDINSLELAEKLHQLAGVESQIIMLSSTDWTDIQGEAHQAGVTGFCSKPVFFSELQNALAEKTVTDIHETETEKLNFKGKKILLAEDNEMNQEIARMVLEDAGFEVDIADDGTETVAKIKEVPENTYDLILMDVQMPHMDGYEATRQIRALPEKGKADIPIVAMTANAFEEDRQEALAAGMDGYVPKPIDIKVLLETLQEILQPKQE